jgi:iron complex outermembrane receptor protein
VERLAFQNKRNRVLPSANFKFDLDDLVLRVAASQTQTLPDYSALGASSYGSDLNRTGGGGNPNLKPVVSTNLDANLEWYFMPRGLLSVGAYHMDLKDYVAFDVVSRQLYSELTNQLETYQISTPINADGKVTGVEVAYEQPIGEYFGVNANYTYADGSTSHTWADGSTTCWAPRRTPTTWVPTSRTSLRCPRQLHPPFVVPDRPVRRQPVLPG